MQSFDSLKNIWDQSTIPGAAKPLPSPTYKNNTATVKLKLQKQQIIGAAMLLITAILISGMAVFGNFNFQHWYTYASMGMICLICLTQAILLYAGYKKIKSIDDTGAPAAYLCQWEEYYALRKKQIKWNLPAYYLLLNAAMGVYFLEVLAGRPVINILIFIAVYLAWMLYTYFYLGKKNVQKENRRLQGIIDELKRIELQLNTQE